MMWSANSENNQNAILVLSVVVLLVIYYLYTTVYAPSVDGMYNRANTQRHQVMRSDGYADSSALVTDAGNMFVGGATGAKSGLGSVQGMTEPPIFWNAGSYVETDAAIRSNLTMEGMNGNMFNEGMRNAYEGFDGSSPTEWHQSSL